MDKTWILKYEKNWDKFFLKLDINTKKKILKKIQQLRYPKHSRKLKKIKFKVEEVGQYKIVYFEDIINNTRKIYFVGNHKQYEKWYKSFI